MVHALRTSFLASAIKPRRAAKSASFVGVPASLVRIELYREMMSLFFSLALRISASIRASLSSRAFERSTYPGACTMYLR